MRLLVSSLLCALICSTGVYAGEQPVREGLFHIERAKNANIVRYDAQVGPDGNFYAPEPVIAYWVRLAGDGQEKKLSWIQKKFAYGFDAYLDLESDSVDLRMEAKFGRSITVQRDGDDYRAVALIDGEDAYIEKVYIQAHGKGLSTRVDYVDLYGVDVNKGEARYERYVP